MEIAVFFMWIVLSTVIGAAGSKRKIGFAGAFVASLALSPLCGLILTAFSESKSEIQYRAKVISLLEKKQINYDEL